MFWFMVSVRVDMRYLLIILQNLLPTILECFYVNVSVSSP